MRFKVANYSRLEIRLDTLHIYTRVHRKDPLRPIVDGLVVQGNILALWHGADVNSVHHDTKLVNEHQGQSYDSDDEVVAGEKNRRTLSCRCGHACLVCCPNKHQDRELSQLE